MLALALTIFGGIRFRLMGARISLMDPWRIWAAAAGVIVLRHLLHRRAPLYGRFLGAVRRLLRDEAVRAVWPAWLLTRAGVLVVGSLAVATFGFPVAELPFRVSEHEWLNLQARHDAGWYMNIATEGYAWSYQVGGQQNIAFWPGLPMLMRVGGRLLGGRPMLAGQVIVLVASLWGLVYVYRIALMLLRDRAKAEDAVTLLAAYPFAVFLGAIYTESLFLLAAAGAFFHAMRCEWWKMAAWAAFAGFLRPNGFLLAATLGVLILTPAPWVPAAWRDAIRWARLRDAIRNAAGPLCAAACAAIGLLVYSAFIYRLTNRPFTWLQAHQAWGRVFEGLDAMLLRTYTHVSSQGVYEFTKSVPVDSMNAAACLLALAALWPVTKRYGPAFGLFIAINLIPPLMIGGLLSIGRLTLTLFPVFLWLADVLPLQHRRAWIAGFAVAQGLGAALFYTWHPFI